MTRFAAIALAILAMGASAFGEPPPDPRPRQEQTLFFRAVLRELGAQPVADFDELLQSPEKKVLIVLGPTSHLDAMIQGGRLRRFIAAGGAVLIATDQTISSNLANQIGAVVGGEFVRGQPGDCYRGTLFDCPLIHEYRRPSRRNQPHPIFRDLPPDAAIATNRPRIVHNWLPPNRPLITTSQPGAWFRDADRLDFRQIADSLVLGVVGENANGGRLLVLADHSIFIDMMVQPDNHNLDFTFGVLRWLTDDGKRTDVLMLDNDSIQTSFNVSLVRPPSGAMPSLQDLLPMMSQRFSELQREDLINKMIRKTVPHSIFMRSTVGILTLALLAAGAYFFLHARHRADWRPKSALAPAGLADSPVGDYADSARELAADVFGEFAPGHPMGSEPPPLAIRGGWRERRQWQSLTRRLWTVANGTELSNTAAALQRVHADCRDLRAAIQSGVVQFAVKS